MTDPTPRTTPTRDEAWRYSINYGPDGEQNFANVYAADGQFVGNLRTHHAIAICNAFAVCEKLASAPAPASGGVDAAFTVASNLLRDGCTYADRKAAADFIRSALSPAATPVSEAEPVAWRWRAKGRSDDDWSTTTKEPAPADFLSCEIEPLYAVARSAQ